MGSEADAARPFLAKFCEGLGIDVGFGGSATVPHALTMDLPQKDGHGGRYTTVGGDKQILQGSCFDLSGFCNESLDFLVQHHLLEDFSYSDLVKIITEWRRTLKIGGRLVCNNPDQQRFKSYIKKHNQGDNLAHHEQDFSLETFKRNVLDKTGPWEITYEMPDDGKYSWYLVATKI